MTPIEAKAKYLIDKHMEFTPAEEEYEFPYAKASALITCNEIIETLNKFADYWDLRNGEWYKDEMAHYQQVKNEINKP